MDWPLVDKCDDGIRPAGPADECIYCQQKVGQPHGPRCVVVTKTVRVRYIIDVDLEMPHFWTKADIEFSRNESSWCADNAIQDIEQHISRTDGQTCTECLCGRFRAEFVEVLDNTPKREVRTPEFMAKEAGFRLAMQPPPTDSTH